jgi:hypothetical protein
MLRKPYSRADETRRGCGHNQVNIAADFHILNTGRPMLMYEETQEMLDFFKAPNMQTRWWSARQGWQIVEHLHTVFMQQLVE